MPSSRRRTNLALAIAVTGVALAVVLGIGLGGAGLLSLGRDPWVSVSSVRSAVLAREMPIEIFAPPSLSECAPQDRTVLFVFHGRGGDQTQWFAGRFGGGAGVDQAARRLIDSGDIRPLAIVSAYIDDSYGVDSEPAADGYTHGPYERYIVDELLPEIENRLDVGGSAETRAVAGISMGGFTALSLGLRTDLFSRVAGLSPAIFANPPRSRDWVYGADGSRDPVVLAETAPLTSQAFFLGYGDRDYDWIRAGTAELNDRLRQRGASLAVEIVPGGHDAATSRQLVEPMLRSLFAVGTDGSCESAVSAPNELTGFSPR